MKLNYKLFSLVLLFSTGIFAQNFQNGTIETTKSKVITGRVSIDNTSKKVTLKKNNTNKTYDFKSLKNISVSGRDYSLLNFKNDFYLASKIETGKATLFDLSNSDYLVLLDNGTGKVVNLKIDKSQIPGILSLLFNDCNDIRNQINKKDINEKVLIELVNSYNNCSYSEYTPTEKEIENANTHNTDILRFYAGVQTSFNNLTINNNSENSQAFGVGFGISVSPSFVGKAQGNLYFDFDVSLLFTGDKDYKGQGFDLNFNNNSYHFSLGLEYLFNKKGTIKPFLGIGYGYTLDYYKGNIGNAAFKDSKQNYFFLPKVGTLFQISNGDYFGLTFSYITEYENNLSFYFNDTLRPLVIKNDFVVVGLSYNF